MGLGEEREAPGEDVLRRRIVAMTERKHEADNPPGTRPVRRGQHAKSHGCMIAEVIVPDDPPQNLRHGLFARPGTYSAWVRFSSSAPVPQPDSRRDAQGLSIKVLDVGAPASASGEVDKQAQDFILGNSRAFFCRDTADYLELSTAVADGRTLRFFLGSWAPWRWRLRELWTMLNAIRHHVDDPLGIRYWSQTPYRLGPHAVKYSAKPTAPAPPPAVTEGPDRLRRVMADRLRTGGASFDLMVQLQVDPRRMPVEDPTVVWGERRSPFRTVATCRIPAQTFDTPERRRFDEALSFSPWHALPEHLPLGGINRVRKPTYQAISRMRHERNDRPEARPPDSTGR